MYYLRKSARSHSESFVEPVLISVLWKVWPHMETDGTLIKPLFFMLCQLCITWHSTCYTLVRFREFQLAPVTVQKWPTVIWNVNYPNFNCKSPCPSVIYLSPLRSRNPTLQLNRSHPQISLQTGPRSWSICAHIGSMCSRQRLGMEPRTFFLCLHNCCHENKFYILKCRKHCLSSKA